MSEQTVIQDLIENGWDHLSFEPFRDGIEVFWLRKDSPQIALLKYHPGASVPRHKHDGLETIFILEGDQVDDKGQATQGDFIINYPGSTHAVRSETGCVVLIHWEKPVVFTE